MDPIFGPIIGAAISSGGSLLGGMFGASGQASTNAANIALAREQMAWQEHMSNTAYQRGMADMKAAGLNPILAANLGGASTGSVSMPTLGNPGSFMQQGVSSAAQAYNNMAQTKQALAVAEKDKSQVELNNATTKYTESNQTLNQVLQDKARQDTATSAAQAAAATTQANLNNANAANAAVQNQVLKANAEEAGHSAKIRGLEFDQNKHYGPGQYGQIGNTAERVFNRLIGGLGEAFRQGPGTGGATSPSPFSIPYRGPRNSLGEYHPGMDPEGVNRR